MYCSYASKSPWIWSRKNPRPKCTSEASAANRVPTLEGYCNVPDETQLMVQKSHSQPPGMYKTLVNSGIKLLLPTSTGEFTGFLNHQLRIFVSSLSLIFSGVHELRA